MNEAPYKYVTKAIPRVEGKSLCLGKPVYMEDQIPKDCLVIKLVHSPHAFAEVMDIDLSEAEKVPGVVRIFTWKDTDIQCTSGFTYSPFEHTLLKKIARYQGDVVAMVVARTEAAAAGAVSKIHIDWDVREPVMDMTKALDNPIVIHGDQLDRIVRHQEPDEVDIERDYVPERNQIRGFVEEYGDFEAALSKCDGVATVQCVTSQQMHCQFETHRSYAYIDDRGILVVMGPMQAVFPLQDSLAVMLGIDKRRIRTVKTQVGGGFGGKNVFTAYMFPAYAAWVLRRPVVLIMTREESLTYTGTRHEYSLEVTVGADKDGVIQAVKSTGILNGGAYCELSEEVLSTGIHNVYPLFPRVKGLLVSQKAVHTNKLMGCAFRGFGATQNVFALNCAVRHLAEDMKLDLPELFLKNIPQLGDSHPLMNGWRPEDPTIIRSIGLRECILRAMELIGWDEKRNKKLPEGNLVRGVGLGVAVHASGVPREDRGCSTLTMNPDGSFSLFSGHSDIGTGSDTAILQIVAETLDVSMDIIRLQAADSGFTPFDNGTYASSNLYRAGSAAKRAADDMKALLIKSAAELLGVDTETLSFEGESFCGSSGEILMTLSEFADKRITYWHGGSPLVTSASFPVDYAPSPYVATCAEVEADRETGQYRLLNIATVVDCGQVVNPVNARVQALGGVVQSIGLAMFEEVKYTSDHHIISKDFETYKIPSQMDVPPIAVEFAGSSYEPTGPFGAKSVGEVTTGSPGPAICDALFNALGVHMDRLPVTPERLLSAIASKEQGDNNAD